MAPLKKIILYAVFAVCTSCSISNTDRNEFSDYYHFRISEIVDYNILTQSTSDIHMQDWLRFLENCDYLESLTGCKFHYIQSEPPIYNDTALFKQDTALLARWLSENGKYWSKQKADKYVYEKRKGHDVYF